MVSEIQKNNRAEAQAAEAYARAIAAPSECDAFRLPTTNRTRTAVIKLQRQKVLQMRSLASYVAGNIQINNGNSGLPTPGKWPGVTLATQRTGFAPHPTTDMYSIKTYAGPMTSPEAPFVYIIATDSPSAPIIHSYVTASGCVYRWVTLHTPRPLPTVDNGKTVQIELNDHVQLMGLAHASGEKVSGDMPPIFITEDREYTMAWGNIEATIHYSQSDPNVASTLPAGVTIEARINVLYYRGEGEQDASAGVFSVFLQSGGATASQNFGGSHSNTWSSPFPAGYYRLVVQTLEIVNNAAAPVNLGYFWLSFRQIAGANTALWAIEQYKHWGTQPGIFDNGRVNASSLLVSNTNTPQYRTGQIYMLRIPPGQHWFDYGIRDVMDACDPDAVQESRAGNLSEGGYTWMRPTDQMQRHRLRFDSETVVVHGNYAFSNIGYPCVTLATLQQHVIICTNPQEETAASAFWPRTMLRLVDTKLYEFESNEGIMPERTTGVSTAVYEQALTMLSPCPVFTENWTHLSQLFKTLRTTAIQVTRGPIRNALRTGLLDLATNVAALVI